MNVQPRSAPSARNAARQPLARQSQAAPLLEAARCLSHPLSAGDSLSTLRVAAAMTATFGASDAAGAWTWRQAYDVCEAAAIIAFRHASVGAARSQPATLMAIAVDIASRLPPQTKRSEAQLRLQQFSTPLPYAVVAATAAGLVRDDVVLEPSCGTGLMAAAAHVAGARLVINEIDPDRAGLASAALGVPVTGLDAEFIDDLLEAIPTVVVMNPPFSASAARTGDPTIAGLHLLSALKKLRAGGRLVAVMPDGFSGEGSLRTLWREACERARLRLRLRVPGAVYARQGTRVETTLAVFDAPKSESLAATAPVIADIDDLGQALAIAIDIGATRPHRGVASPAPAKRAVAATSGPVVTPKPAARQSSLGDMLIVRRETGQPLDYELVQAAGDTRSDGLYASHRLARIAIPGAQVHPTPLVESAAMAAVTPPAPTERPILPPSIVRRGGLSDAQLESVVYAATAFARDLPGAVRVDDEWRAMEPCAEDAPGGVRLRQGFFLGDGTGCGKGRQVAGVILDAWMRGCKRAIWVSQSDKLIEDAIRDWTALGGDAGDIKSLARWKLGDPITAREGILFVTYATLRVGPRQGKTGRLEQLVAWAGRDFEGVIAFDESHAMGGAAASKSDRGAKKGSQQGVAGLRLQLALPRARVLYVSATGATTIENFAYASRLGLWGAGDYPFQTREDFMTAMEAGGVAAMEVVARDLKALGLYVARALSFEGVEYDILDHALEPEQIAVYDAYAEAFQLIHRNLQAAMQATGILDAEGGCNDSCAKGAVRSRFESLKQRFFNHLLIGMKTPSMLNAIEQDLAEGRSAVIQLISTGEALMERRLDALAPGEHDDLRIDLTPREYVLEYLREAFPTEQRRVCEDENGTIFTEIVRDEHGAPVRSREACAMRDAMIEALCLLEPVQTALDQIVWRFGPDRVAEATGRSRRIVPVGEGPARRLRVERRAASANFAETRAFMDGAKRILVFSQAGGTGRSYHANKTAQNQERRVHYLLEAGWRADVAIQGLGRAHRSNQVSAPWIRLVSTDVKGEKRFISTIARRLDSLGALTRGAARTGGQNLFRAEDNLEGRFAKAALRSFYAALVNGAATSMTLARFTDRTALTLCDGEGVLLDDLPPITQFLNRVLALTIADQNALFAEFEAIMAGKIEAAAAMGLGDGGVEVLKADGVEVVDRQTLRVCPVSGAETLIWRLKTRIAVPRLSVEDIERLHGPDLRRVRNARSQAVAFSQRWNPSYDDDGRVIPQVRLIRPRGREVMTYADFLDSHWHDCEEARFSAAWSQAVAALPAFEHDDVAMISGLVLPIWKHLPNDAPMVRRVSTDCGRMLIGRMLELDQIGPLADAAGPAAAMDPASVARAVMVENRIVALTEGARLKRRLVAGRQRCELENAPRTMIPALKAAGCFVEIISHTARVFVPVDADLGEKSVAALEVVLKLLKPVGGEMRT